MVITYFVVLWLAGARPPAVADVPPARNRSRQFHGVDDDRIRVACDHADFQ
jgi:hypothetical protein